MRKLPISFYEQRNKVNAHVYLNMQQSYLWVDRIEGSGKFIADGFFFDWNEKNKKRALLNVYL